MPQRTKNVINEIRVKKAENGYVVVTEYIDEDKPSKIHICTAIDDVFATIEKEFV